jgi:hypothetical protein
MTYVSWAIAYEGPSDGAYFEILIPRTLEEVGRHGTRPLLIPAAPAVTLSHRAVEKIVEEACNAREAFHVVFIHADTGGRNLEKSIEARSCAVCKAMNERCDWPLKRCVVIAPRHETEAWILADDNAITSALGYSGSAKSIGLPITAKEAEKITDPKSVLEKAVKAVRGRHRSISVGQMYAAIAQRQSFDRLRQARSFLAFETDLQNALIDLGWVQALTSR